MKKLFLVLIIPFVLSFAASAQEAQTFAESIRTSTNQFKQCFTPEGKKEWRPEVTLGCNAFVFTSGWNITVGVRLDEKRVWGIGSGHVGQYYDAIPGNAYHIPLYIWNRHYYYLGKKHKAALYSDIKLGAGYVYDGVDDPEERYAEDTGDIVAVLRFSPGLSVNLIRQFRLNVGAVIGTDTFGLYLGLAL